MVQLSWQNVLLTMMQIITMLNNSDLYLLCRLSFTLTGGAYILHKHNAWVLNDLTSKLLIKKWCFLREQNKKSIDS